MIKTRPIDSGFHKNNRMGASSSIFDDTGGAIPGWVWLLVIMVVSLLIVVR